MWLTESLQHRLQQPEMMDQPTLDRKRHIQALRGLERINYLSGCAGSYWPAIHEAASAASGRPLRVLDVATGAGDVPLRLWHRAKRAGLNVEIAGCDRSSVAVAHARRQAEAQQAQVRFFQADILGEPFSERYDVVMCSLFLHHLAEEEVIQVLRTMAQVARDQVLVSDLRRSRLGWWFAWIGTRMLTMSPVVQFDGPVSVAAAFTCSELKNLADRAGLQDARLVRCWPSRMFLTWRKPT
jgi:2-polyprenyl-3-methyl-5-hydroxy-6-metoxy-1,4-benzoquinol methylase